jgi:hypothetical protein
MSAPLRERASRITTASAKAAMIPSRAGKRRHPRLHVFHVLVRPVPHRDHIGTAVECLRSGERARGARGDPRSRHRTGRMRRFMR